MTNKKGARARPSTSAFRMATFLTALSAAVAVVVVASSCAVVYDKWLERRMVGQWHQVAVLPDGARFEQYHTFLPDGRYSIIQVGSVCAVNSPCTVRGRWHVEDGYLHETVDTSDPPGLVPKGLSTADKIINITVEELTTESHGIRMISQRVRPTSNSSSCAR
jgi:hypothetical protein